MTSPEFSHSAPENERRLALGRSVLAHVRAEANDGESYFGHVDTEDRFTDLYLTPRDSALPPEYVDMDIHSDVRALYAQVFNGVRQELELRMGREEPLWVVIDPCPDDHTAAVLCTDTSLLLFYQAKPWRFWWENETEMGAELGRWCETAATRLLAERQERTNIIYGTRHT